MFELRIHSANFHVIHPSIPPPPPPPHCFSITFNITCKTCLPQSYHFERAVHSRPWHKPCTFVNYVWIEDKQHQFPCNPSIHPPRPPPDRTYWKDRTTSVSEISANSLSVLFRCWDELPFYGQIAQFILQYLEISHFPCLIPIKREEWPIYNPLMKRTTRCVHNCPPRKLEIEFYNVETSQQSSVAMHVL